MNITLKAHFQQWLASASTEESRIVSSFIQHVEGRERAIAEAVGLLRGAGYGVVSPVADSASEQPVVPQQ